MSPPVLSLITARTGQVGYRFAAPPESSVAAMPIVLLHGIGSGAASWLATLEALGAERPAYAWDAPGYGDSSPVTPLHPVATDYAEVLCAWLDALGLQRVLLVGHSLGAIMAGCFAALNPQRVAGLLLLSPAVGYGAATPELRAQKLHSRLDLLHRLGPQGMAEQRSGNLLGPNASAAARATVQANMALIKPAGYEQATYLLTNADLSRDLAAYRGPRAIAVGAEDSVTTPASCDALALATGLGVEHLPGLGHACYVEAPEILNPLIKRVIHSFLEQDGSNDS
jgi:pimeloyl-ACP methyl ester carboxylesterase